MTIPRPDKSIKNLRRYRQIAAVLIKYGFGELVYRMNLASPLKPGRKAYDKSAKSTQVRIRLALEELGPTFVKLGQVLSTRPFMLPMEYIEELSKLQDQVEPMPADMAMRILSRELGRPVEECFSEFNDKAFASASLAQVHDAVLLDGTQVVVKIQREGIKEIISSDMRILYDVASLLERNIPESHQYDPNGLVEELSRSTQKEINFLNEARNIEIFADNFKDEPGIKVHKVYRELSTSKVLTLEKITGIKISRIDELKRAGYDLEEICKNGARLVLKMIFEDGFFHADPHPGNLFVCDGSIIAPVDYGMMGVLSASQMNMLSDLITTIVSRDVGAIVRVLENSGVVPDEANIKVLEQDISELIVKYYHISLAKMDMRTATDDFFMLASTHGIKFQAEFMLLGKALITYEELARILYPQFNFFTEAVPYIKKLTARKYRPANLMKDLARIADELKWLLVESPREFRQVVGKLNKGEFQVQMQHKGLEPLIREIDRSSNRVSVSLLVAALIVGSSMIITVEKGYMLFNLPLLGLVGFLFAGILGVYLIISILRSGKL